MLNRALPGPTNREISLQLKGYRLATAEILYHMPDHPSLLQSFVWQHLDLAPEFPELRKFLDFWRAEIDGSLHSVRVARQDLIDCTNTCHAGAWLQIH